jgi:hypothetical protein
MGENEVKGSTIPVSRILLVLIVASEPHVKFKNKEELKIT